MKKKLHLLFLLFAYIAATSQPIIEINTKDEIVKARGAALSILKDSTGSLSINDVLLYPNFKPSTQKIPNLGVSNAVYWIQFKIQNNTEINDLILQVANPLLDKVSLFEVTPNGNITEQSAGEYEKFENRKYKYQDYLFDLSIKPNTHNTYYLKLKCSEQLLVPISMGSKKVLFEENIIKDYIFGIFSGIILVMFLYNLFIFISVRDKSYFYYIVYILFIGLTQAQLHGYTFKYLWPNNIWITNHITIIASIGSIAASLFTKNFLKMKHYAPKLIWGINIIIGIYCIAIIMSILNLHILSYNIVDINGLLLALYILLIVIVVSLKNYRPAKFFLVAWTIFLAGVVIFVLRSFGILPYNMLTNYTMPAGLAAEVVLLSFALADRINIMRREKHEAQKRELNERKEKQEILEKQAETLKIEVEKATKSLKDAQAQLVQSEKMASLGQFAAGMSHEINNMMNISQTGAQALKQNFDFLKTYIVQIEGLQEKLDEAKNLRDEMEIDEVYEGVDDSLELVKSGIDRAVAVTRKLKNFSKVDNTNTSIFNLNKDIEDIIDIQKGNLLKGIQIETKLNSIPMAHGDLSELNQAILNIIDNATYAIHKANILDGEGKITIETSFFNGKIVLSFTDNGMGMPAEVKDKVFDIFYTTKPVGSQGIGLSTVYATMKKLNGDVEVDSEEGVGTTIRLIIPAEQ